MAAPLAPLLLGLGRAVFLTLKRWPGALALTGMIMATGFTFKVAAKQAGETALSLWPLLALACFVLLAREVIKAWIKIKKDEKEVVREP